MTRVMLIRPGATDYDDQGRIKGQLDIPLNRRGYAQIADALDTAGELTIDTIYCAPCQAAEETAHVVANAWNAKRIKTVERLRNLDAGLWQGKLISEVRSQQPKVYRRWQEQPDTMCPPKGEMLDQARSRATAALERLLKKHRSGVLAVVIPEPLATLLESWLTEQPIGDLWQAEGLGGRCKLIDPALSSATPK